LRAESVFVQPHHGRLSRTVVNRHHVKPERAFADVPFAQESLRGSNDNVLLFPGDTQFRKRGRVFKLEKSAMIPAWEYFLAAKISQI
jgi:hypothetical protein